MVREIVAKQSAMEIVPQGMHKAVCIGVYDLDYQDTKIYGYKHQILVRWELSVKMKDDRPFTMIKRYTLNISPKSTLRKHIEAWLARGLTEEEIFKGYNVCNLEGKPCFVTVIHSEKNGNTRADISAISPLPAEVKPFDPINKIGETPDWVQKIIDEQIYPDKINTSEQAVEEPVDDGVPF